MKRDLSALPTFIAHRAVRLASFGKAVCAAVRKARIIVTVSVCAALFLQAGTPRAAKAENLFTSMQTTDIFAAPFEAAMFGERPTLMWLWASSDSYCNSELLELEAVSREYAGRINVVGVLLDAVSQDGKSIMDTVLATARNALEERGVSFPSIVASPGLYDVMRYMGISAVPTTWLVDTGGAILYQAVGAMGGEGYRQAIIDVLFDHTDPFPTETERERSGEYSLFFDGFDEGSRNWRLEEGWMLSEEGGNAALRGTGHSWAVPKGGVWSNYSFSTRFRLDTGTIHFSFRKNEVPNGLERYFVGVTRDFVYLRKQIGDSFTELSEFRISLNEEWHAIEIRGYEGLLSVLVDGVPCLTHEDADAITSGGIAFEILDHSVCLVDDVNVVAITTPGDMPFGTEEGGSVHGTEFEAAAYGTLKVGDVDPGVRRIRDRLYELGYYQNRYDHDRYTQSTADIVAHFQRVNGLPADGVATPETQALMFSDRAMPKP